MPPGARRRDPLFCRCLLLVVIQAVVLDASGAAGQASGTAGHHGQCQMILTSGYGYRQFIPLEAALAPADEEDPMAGYAAPAAPGPAPTPAPRLQTQAAAPTAATAGSEPGPPRLLLHFQVMAESDAHILLSAQRRSDREAYEVVLGAGNNTYTDFRRLPASLPPRRAFNYSTGVVSGGELRAFWLLADLRTGVLAVGPAGGAPILAWVDPEPLAVRYVSLCTWTDVEGTWLYGCDRRGNASTSGVLDPEGMRPAERVRQHVLSARKRTPPHHDVDVLARLDVARFVVDDRLGVLAVSGTLVTEWWDERLAWNPADFDGLNATNSVSPTDIWLPHVHHADPVLPALAGLLLGGEAALRLHLRADGRLRAQRPVELRARCAFERGADGGDDFLCVLGVAASLPARVRLKVLLAGSSGTSRWTWTDAQPVLPDAGPAAPAVPANDSAQDVEEAGRGSSDDHDAAPSVRIRVRRTGTSGTGVFLAAYIAACSCCALSLLSPAASPAANPTASAPASQAPPPQGLLAALTLLMTALAMLSLQAALPPAVLAAAPSSVFCLSAALAVAAATLLLQTLPPAAGCWPCAGAGTTSSCRLPQLPRALNKLLRSASLARVLLCRAAAADRPRWRACPSGTPTERVLEMLDAMDAEEARRDWHILAVVLEKVAAVMYIVLVLAAITPIALSAK